MGYNKFIKKDGKVLLDLTSDTVASDKLMSGVTAHNRSGEAINGTFTIDNELATQDNLIAQIQTALEGKAAGGGGGGSSGGEWINLYSLSRTRAANPTPDGEYTTVYYQIPEWCTRLLFICGSSVDRLNSTDTAFFNKEEDIWEGTIVGTESLICSIENNIATIAFLYEAAYMLPINVSLLP